MEEYAVISDIHGNLEALDAVLADISAKDSEAGIKRKLLCLGDVVGYGPNPNECIAAVKNKKHVLECVAGNHDWAVLGLTGITYFSEYARQVIRWTGEVLSDANRAVLETFPLVKLMEKEGLFLVHGSPYEPQKWHYLLYFSDAEINFENFKGWICLIGHSHLPFVMERSPSGGLTASKTGTELTTGCRYIINPGSVGQPRDGDPRASYLLLNGSRAEIVRVQYDFSETQRKMRAAGLPPPFVERLQRGL
ncbi:MAG: metallophosphoesterase family protein [Nitrospiraceae bacterium]|nr:metallophosphoesterase family protein [Nitrospiraceae bacterium]